MAQPVQPVEEPIDRLCSSDQVPVEGGQKVSKGKSRNVYIATHLKADLKVHKNTAHLDNPICKTMAKTFYLMSVQLKDLPMLLG